MSTCFKQCFLVTQCDAYKTWAFWHNFVFQDALAYIGLYLAIRGGMWDMRMGSLKEMCPLFAAIDRLNYRKIIPQHIADVLSMPAYIQDFLQSGGFVCNLKANRFSAVGFDEAHEMCINKDIKATVVRPSKEYLDKIMYYYPVRAKVCKNQKKSCCTTYFTDNISNFRHFAAR